MKKLFFMLLALITCSVASAQTENTPDKKTEKADQGSMVNTDDTRKNTTATQERKRKDKKSTTTIPIQKRERVRGTTGTIDFPDTEGAGTGTGNDTRIGVPPGEPEPGTEKR